MNFCCLQATLSTLFCNSSPNGLRHLAVTNLQICFLSLWTGLFWIFYMYGLVQYIAFCVRLLSVMFSRFITFKKISKKKKFLICHFNHFLSVQFSGTNYIPSVVQPLLLFPKFVHHPKQKPCTH